MTFKNNDLSGIEALRFFCSITVVIYHYPIFFSSATRPSPLPDLLSGFYHYGLWAVHVFWMISGFIFYRNYADRIRTRVVGFADFSFWRFSRLYPLHLLTLLIVAVGQLVYGATHGNPLLYDASWSSFVYQLLFASNWFPWQTYSFNSPIWSVSAEILTYVAFFFVIRFSGAGLFMSAIMCALATMGSAYLKRHDMDWFFTFNVFDCAAFFFAGGIAEKLLRQGVFAVIAAVAAVLTWFLIASGVKVADSKSVMIIAFGLVGAFGKLGNVSVLKPAIVLGQATYSSYLLHFPIALFIVIITDALGVDRAIFLSPVALIGFVVVVIASSFPVYRCFERPTQDWLRALFARKAQFALQSRSIS
jgi:peptidoglycan/LPS O-acetylase OafA/YrhL